MEGGGLWGIDIASISWLNGCLWRSGPHPVGYEQSSLSAGTYVASLEYNLRLTQSDFCQRGKLPKLDVKALLVIPATVKVLDLWWLPGDKEKKKDIWKPIKK